MRFFYNQEAMSAVSDRFQRGVAHREQRFLGAASEEKGTPK